MRFYRPLRIGHVVEVEARLLHTGRTSMHVGVHVRSGDPAQGPDGMELTTYCRTIFVAIDEERRAVPCPTWVPANDEDRALDAHAVELRPDPRRSSADDPTFSPDPGSFTFAPEPFPAR